jgi:hypothetical protein
MAKGPAGFATFFFEDRATPSLEHLVSALAPEVVEDADDSPATLSAAKRVLSRLSLPLIEALAAARSVTHPPR